MQKIISPRNLNDRPAWFKTFYCLGEIIPCWWHPVTNSYKTLTDKEADEFELRQLWEITELIKNACKLSFFSTEIVLQEDNKFIAANYVYDKPDMRRQSRFNDGLPDEIVNKVIEKCSLFAKKNG